MYLSPQPHTKAFYIGMDKLLSFSISVALECRKSELGIPSSMWVGR